MARGSQNLKKVGHVTLDTPQRGRDQGHVI